MVRSFRFIVAHTHPFSESIPAMTCEGPVSAVLIPTTGEITCCCEECDWVWDHPLDARSKPGKFSYEDKFGKVQCVDPSKEQLERLGWSDFVVQESLGL